MSKEIATQSVPAAEARQRLGQIMRQVYNREVRVIVEKGGIPVVAVVSLADFERWTRLDREREERYRVIDEIRSRNLDKEPEEVEQDVTEEVAALRREKRERKAS